LTPCSTTPSRPTGTAELRGVADDAPLHLAPAALQEAAVGGGEHRELDRDPCRWSSIATAMRYFLPRSR
jgi:hypothetical protein